jgi:cysteine dioxygenase
MPALSLQDVTDGLRRIFSHERVDVDEVRFTVSQSYAFKAQVKQLLGSYKASCGDWTGYAMFDTHRYTRNLVDTGNGRYNLMILCWGPSMASSVHDHADAHCFVKMLQGQVCPVVIDTFKQSVVGRDNVRMAYCDGNR